MVYTTNKTRTNKQEQQKEAFIDKEHSEIGLRVARVAYSSVKEGKGGKFFERC